MSNLTKTSANIFELKRSDLVNIDPSDLDFDVIRKTADKIKKYLENDAKDPYTICVKSRAAMNSVSECIRVVSEMAGYYKSQAKRYYSIAVIEKADSWFAENKPDVKITDGMRKTYADMDEEYLVWKNKESSSLSLLEYLRNKRMDFEHDLNLAKKKMGEDFSDERKAHFSTLSDDEEYDG